MDFWKKAAAVITDTSSVLDTSEILDTGEVLDISKVLGMKDDDKEDKISGPYYYSFEGKYLGSANNNINEVRLGKDAGKTPSGSQRYTPVDGEGNDMSAFLIIHTEYEEFKKILGTIYNENSSKSQIPGEEYDWREAAGIYDVMENKAVFFSGTVQSSWFQNAGIFGLNKNSSKAVREYIYNSRNLEFKDDNGRSDKIDLQKLEIVTRGVIAGMINPNSQLDYSGGGTVWQGKDFSRHYAGTFAYEKYYLVGFFFTNVNHDIFDIGTYPNDNYEITYTKNDEVILIKLRYKYLSTAAWGGTTFMKRSWWSFSDNDKNGKANFPVIQDYYIRNRELLSEEDLQIAIEALITKHVRKTANF